MLFVHQGTPRDAVPVFEELWPEARAVSDPTLDFYRAFGIGRAGWGQLFGPAVVLRALDARRRGFFQGKTIGDGRLMPGAFLIGKNRVIWSHRYAHPGDRPDFASLCGASG